MKGKRIPYDHLECRKKQTFKRDITEREADYLLFQKEFQHIESDTIAGARHKSAVITLVERLTKVILPLKSAGRMACHIETTLNQLFKGFPETCSSPSQLIVERNSSNGNRCATGTPSQRALNEHSNGLLRKDGLP